MNAVIVIYVGCRLCILPDYLSDLMGSTICPYDCKHCAYLLWLNSECNVVHSKDCISLRLLTDLKIYSTDFTELLDIEV